MTEETEDEPEMVETEDKLPQEEEKSFEIEDRDQPVPPVSVVAYNEQRACADLYRMFVSGRLELQPDFQRDVVWKPDEQVRFIDSIVKNLPIPSMCFSLDARTQKWKVIDGLQRMSSIVSFLGEAPWRMSAVDDVHNLLKNRTNIQLRTGTDDERRLYAAVEDVTIPITVIRCDYDEDAHMRYLFMIFNRLNSGGVRLNNQEIRNCIYSGPFNSMLKDFDAANAEWRHVKRQIWGKMERFRSVEILLRTIAFASKLESYDGNLAGFLNSYMLTCMRLPETERAQLMFRLAQMAKSSRSILTQIPSSAKRPLTFVEGILVGSLSAHDRLLTLTDDQRAAKLTEIAEAYPQLPALVGGARYGLANEADVKRRLREAIHLFAS